MRIKLKDIATLANVSTATVSRVLNGSTNVDERTRDMVLQALKEIGYPLPGVSARAHRCITLASSSPTGRTSSYIDQIVGGVEAIARQNGYQLTMQRVTLENPAEEELEQLARAESVVLTGGAVQPRVIDLLEQANIPFVLASAHRGAREINCVQGDYLQGASQAIHALAHLGHRRIALVNGPSLSTTSLDKLAGYRLGLAETGLAQDERLIVSADGFGPAHGQEATRQLLDQTRDFSAIIFATDSQAIGGLSALKEAGIEVPGDVSLVGFYDEPFSPFTDPPLASVNINWHRIGEIAALRITALLEQHDTERLHIIIPVKLIVRASMAAAPGPS